MTGRALVVGAGVGGLATAIALHARGWDVVVRERAEGPSMAGTALGMWPEAMAALDSLGVGDVVRQTAVLSRGATILRPDGSMIGRIPERQRAYLLSRERLLSALHDRLPPGTVRWRSGVSEHEPLPDADLVVGADGIRSAVRARAWGGAPVRDLGTVAYRGVADGAVDGVTETWGSGALFGITPTSNARTNWFACLRADAAPSEGVEHLDVMKEYFRGWYPRIADVLARTDDAVVDRRDLLDVSLTHPYVVGRVALVGDAAHAMAPNLGRGACESLIDAVVLACEIGDAPSVAEGLRRYDRARRTRTKRVVAAARLLNRLATASRGTRLRDGVAALALRR